MDLKTAIRHATDWGKDRHGLAEDLGVATAYESATDFLLQLEAKDFLEGRNPLGFLLDPPWVNVSKLTARVTLLGWEAAQQAQERMDRVSLPVNTP